MGTLLSGFVKVKFDGSIRDEKGGAGFVIRDPDAKLLVVGGVGYMT